MLVLNTSSVVMGQLRKTGIDENLKMRNKGLTFIFGILLLIEFICGQFVPKLTFISGEFTIMNRIIGYLFFSGFIISLLLLVKVKKRVTISVGIILSIIVIINSLAEIHPIDTTTEPVDIAILHTDLRGRKTIVRNYINVKTNKTIQDTALVKDILIFRYIYGYTKSN